MSDPITTCDGERIKTADERAVEALICLRHMSDFPDCSERWTLNEAQARAILAAIRAGKVPGVRSCACDKDGPCKLHGKEVEQLRAQVKVLQGSLEAAREMGRKAQVDADGLRARHAELIDEVDKISGRMMEALTRAEKAESRHAEAAALLRELSERLVKWANESRYGGWSTHQVDPMLKVARGIDAFLAREGGK